MIHSWLLPILHTLYPSQHCRFSPFTLPSFSFIIFLSDHFYNYLLVSPLPLLFFFYLLLAHRFLKHQITSHAIPLARCPVPSLIVKGHLTSFHISGLSLNVTTLSMQVPLYPYYSLSLLIIYYSFACFPVNRLPPSIGCKIHRADREDAYLFISGYPNSSMSIGIYSINVCLMKEGRDLELGVDGTKELATRG